MNTQLEAKTALAERIVTKADDLAPILNQAKPLGLLVEVHTMDGWKEVSWQFGVRVQHTLAATVELLAQLTTTPELVTEQPNEWEPAPTPPAFKKGDIIRLKSGSQLLTVDYHANKGDMVSCTYWDSVERTMKHDYRGASSELFELVPPGKMYSQEELFQFAYQCRQRPETPVEDVFRFLVDNYDSWKP